MAPKKAQLDFAWALNQLVEKIIAGGTEVEEMSVKLETVSVPDRETRWMKDVPTERRVVCLTLKDVNVQDTRKEQGEPSTPPRRPARA